MIRPITILCGALAFGSFIYLYYAKHEVELMDKRIVELGKQTDIQRAESRRKLDDWIRLGQPEQMRKYSDEYLGLQTIQPTQFVRLTELAGRLPEARVFTAEEPMEAAEQQAGVGVQVAAVPAPVIRKSIQSDAAIARSLPVSVPLAAPLAAPLATPLAAQIPKLTAVSMQAAKPASPPPRGTIPEPGAETARRLAITQPAPTQPAPAAAPPLQTAAAPPLQTGAAPPLQTAAGAPPLHAQAPRPGLTAAEPRPKPAQPAPQRPVPAVVAQAQPPLQARPQPAQPTASTPSGPIQGQPVAQATRQQSPTGGSLLGMAHNVVPLPQPMPTPVSAVWSGR